MDVVLDGIDDDYAEFLMLYRGPDLTICNGDDLVRAMEAGVMWEDFLRIRGR